MGSIRDGRGEVSTQLTRLGSNSMCSMGILIGVLLLDIVARGRGLCRGRRRRRSSFARRQGKEGDWVAKRRWVLVNRGLVAGGWRGGWRGGLVARGRRGRWRGCLVVRGRRGLDTRGAGSRGEEMRHELRQ